MQLIFGKENAEMLRERYTVLELETVIKDGVTLDVYCVISAEQIGITNFPLLENWVKLHNEMLHGYHTNQYNYVRQAIEHLMGKFGGEVDSFYEEIIKRIDQAEKNPAEV